MHRHSGMALFEMVLSLLLFSIIAGGIILLFANPVQDLIWQMRMRAQMEDLKACLNIIARDLDQQSTVEVQFLPEGIRLIGHAPIAKDSIEYRFLNQTHFIQRKSQSGLETLLTHTDANLTPFTSANSKGLVIALQTQKTKIQLAMPIILYGTKFVSQ